MKLILAARSDAVQSNAPPSDAKQRDVNIQAVVCVPS